jgi:urease accessory protein
MSWHARLSLDYCLQSHRTVLRHSHSGPLRVLQSLYPEGDAICHNVLVHPPGGLVGGDTLEITARVASGAHALVTSPGAARYYRSDGLRAQQRVQLQVEAGARLEWLPLEAICYSGCLAENSVRLQLAPGAEMMGWDVTALGLPQSGQDFSHGEFAQRLEMPGVWLEQGRIRAQDRLLLDGPLGLAGQRCLATLFFAAGEPMARMRREVALAEAQELAAANALATSVGVTCLQDRLILLRVLAPVVEPAMQLLRQIHLIWRLHLWNLSAPHPRIWST